MKLLNFYINGVEQLGVHTEKGILDIRAAATIYQMTVPLHITEVVEKGKEAITALTKIQEISLNNYAKHKELFYEENTLQFAPCVTKPEKIICIGLNYRKHAEETNAPIPTFPVVFSKYRNALTGHKSIVPIPPGAKSVDYEVELAIVIGKKAKDIAIEDAHNYVFGYCCANDLSERDWQMRTSQWVLGKTCDQFAPIGPYLVTADEINDPQSLEIKCYVNGEVRQHSNTSDMIFRCDEIISYLSHHMTLEPGDIILTGTPEGVVFGLPETERVYLKATDRVIVEIEKLGKLEITMG